MILKSLELRGFKTFPDKTTLTFERGVTSVVGPNGSGKSNISDAIRWVLGEQSVRSLRCGKMEDVIFSGTPSRKAMGYAEVTLAIDNADRGLPFDSDEVAVTRRYYRSGESEYLINGAAVRLKDINEMFMDTGLGRDGYSIIGQGRIDAIVAAKSEDRREIFEEAAGISRYRYRKEDAERRLGRAEENLIRLRDILGELEDRVGPLKAQAEKAEKFIAYDGEKKGLEIGIWLETLDRSGRVLREHEEKLGAAQAQREDIDGRLEEVAARIEENFREAGASAARIEEARNQAAQLEEQAVRAEGEGDVLLNEMEHSLRDAQRLAERKAELAQSDQEVDQAIDQRRAQAQEREKEVAASHDKLLSFTQKLEEARQHADEATRQIERAAVEAAQRGARLSEERVRQSAAQSSLGELGLRAGAVEESLSQLEGREAAARQEGEELSQMLADADRNTAALENAIKGHELRLDSRRKKAEAAKAEADRLTLDTNEQLRRVRLLEDLERNLEGFTQSVKAVMREAGRGMLSGVRGPISRLMETPGEYAVALETALGGAMQDIVVETEADAKEAIRALKRREIGRATFLPLDTVKGSPLDTKGLEDLPGFVGIAARLCQCAPEYHGVRDHLLGRIVVAEDLDSAAAIARRGGYRFRVVSLDGQVVNPGGSLTGGSRARNSGLLSRAAEIQKGKEEAERLRLRAEEAQAAYRDRMTELSASEAELDAARGELVSAQEERVRVQAEAARVVRELENLAQERESLDRERQESGKRARELEGQAAAAGEAIAQLEKEIAAAEAESQKLAGSREERMGRVEEITRTIQELRMGEYTAQAQRDDLLRQVEELLARKRDAAGAALALEEEMAAAEERRRDLEGRIAACRERAEGLRAQAEERRQGAQSVTARRTELEKEAGELRQLERDLTAQRERIGQELARLQERGDHTRKEYDGIIARLWEDYELTRREAEEVGTKIDDLPAAQRRLAELKNKIKALGAVNVGAVVEYQEVSQRYEFLREQTQDVEKSKAELLTLIDDLTGRMRERFTEKFAEINRHFGAIFRELFGGGAAELTFTDEGDALRSGIEIKVHPPGKIVTHIESLSGGEKALVAISIYFAIMRVNPPPFCVLDEIEAALDDVNVARYAQYLRRMSRNSQFISITHRRGTMEGSDMLYGVTMQDEGISKLLALRTEETEGLVARS